jgi:hypothetical protein
MELIGLDWSGLSSEMQLSGKGEPPLCVDPPFEGEGFSVCNQVDEDLTMQGGGAAPATLQHTNPILGQLDQFDIAGTVFFVESQ